MSSHQSFDNLLRWRCIGPFRGGRVIAVSGSYQDRGTFYFGAVGGGVWKTTDAGWYWQCVTDGFLNTSAVGALAVAPSDDNVIYVGMGETTIRYDVSHGDGVYKSTDAGRTWTHLGLEDTQFIGKVRVHPQDPDTVWVAALGHAYGPNEERGVYKSTDGGETWRKTLFVSNKAGAVDLSIDESNPRIMYATIWEALRSPWQIQSGGPDCGLWRSFDGGETWEDITANHGLPQGVLGKMGVAASPAQSGRVWAIIEHRDEGGLYRSDNYGDTWTKVSDNQNLISRAWYYMHVTADPVDAETVYVNNLDFWKSTDGGRTFVEIQTGHGDNHDLWIDPKDNQRMIQGNDGGAGVSINGGKTFSTLYNQPTAQLYHIDADSRENYIVYATQQDNSSFGIPTRVPDQVTGNSGIRWADTFIAGSGESGYIKVNPDNPDLVYLGAIGSSPGGGNSMQRYDHKSKQVRLITSWPEGGRGKGAIDMKQRFAWTYPIVFSPHDSNTIYIGGDRVYRSTNEGQSWEPISPDLTVADPATLQASGGPVNLDAVGAETYATVFAFDESPLEKGLFWAGSDDGLIHISRDGGETWENITPPDLPKQTLISMIEPSPFDAGTAYVAGTRYKLDDFSPYLYVTRDYGQTWKRINDGIPANDYTRVIRADREQPSLLYAGTETGLYVSLNDGESWQKFQLNLPVSPIYDLIVKGSDLVVATHGRSIWVLDDVTPLRQVVAEKLGNENHLFAPRATPRVLPGIRFANPPETEVVNYVSKLGGGFTATVEPEGSYIINPLDSGENPPAGVIITYHLTETPAEPLELIFSKADGSEVRRFSSRLATDPVIAKELRAPARPGWNRFIWDMRHVPSSKIKGTDPVSGAARSGPFVAPGEFTVTLKIGDTTLSQPFTLTIPEVATATQADLDEQEKLLLDIAAETNRMIDAINTMRDLRSQIDAITARGDKSSAEVKAAKSLRESILEIEKTFVVPDLRSGWGDEGNHGARLWHKIGDVPSVVQLGDYRPTDASYEVFAHLTEQIEASIAAMNTVIAEDIPAVNADLEKAGLGTIIA